MLQHFISRSQKEISFVTSSLQEIVHNEKNESSILANNSIANKDLFSVDFKKDNMLPFLFSPKFEVPKSDSAIFNKQNLK